MIMKRIHYIVCVCAFLIGIGAHAYAALPGTTCSTAIPLGDNYSAQITGPKTVWYTAWTFDLPLSVYFAPQNDTDPKPEVEMDFSCTSGVYTDSIICSLFCKNSGSGIQFDMPHKPALKETTIEGHKVYYLAIGKEYRDLLLKTGISYNVEVFVKVTYKSAGTISIAPDDMFTNCMDGPKFMHLGDTVNVVSQDVSRHVIVPYVQWQEDSIRYVWNGTAPVIIAVGNECEFDPTDNGDEHILDYVTLQPQDTLKMTSEEVRYYIHSDDVTSEAGMFFAKFYTTGTGVMKIERVPQAPPRGDATLLRYDRTVAIPTDTNKLFAIPYTWDTATIFTTPTNHIFKMYIGTEPDFYLTEAIATYQFHANDAGHWLGLKGEQMQALWTHTTEQYLYVRFECSAKTTLTPAIWALSDCAKKNTVIEINRPSSTLAVEKGSYGAVYYRFYYREWKDGDMKFQWTKSNGTCPTFIGDNCSFGANKNDSHVFDNKTIAKNGSWTIAQADIADYEERVDEEGYLYIRFNPSYAGTMTISTTAPEEQDPAPIVYPASTISVVCNGEKTTDGQAYIVRVSRDQSLSLYSGELSNITSRTPIETWSQTTSDTHVFTLQPGTYSLIGNEESVQINVE